MRFAEDVTGLIGRTPLVRLNRIIAPGSNLLLAKLEQFNPLLSVKDRTALGMINAAEKSGAIKKGDVLIEATSGNTGIGLAFISAVRGYRLIVTMPDSMSLERQTLLRLFGAQVVLTPAHEGMAGAVNRAQALQKENSGSFLVRQFSNPANPEIHEVTTAEEIWADTDGRVDVVVCGVGTGGTLTGVGRALKKKKHSVKMVAVEPSGSPVLSGGSNGPHMIQGIGAGFVPEVLDRDLIDEVVAVSNEEAFAATRELSRVEGILGGISSGAAVAGARKWLSAHTEVQSSTIVIIFPDAGERYLSIPQFLKG